MKAMHPACPNPEQARRANRPSRELTTFRGLAPPRTGSGACPRGVWPVLGRSGCTPTCRGARLCAAPPMAAEIIVRVTELPTARTFSLTVTGVADVGPRVRRVTLSGEGLAGFTALPGQDVVLHLTDDRGGGISRRYTIRHLDTERLHVDLDFVLHGHGPAALWATVVSVGDSVEIFGPRGKVRLSHASWQLFAGDESAFPAIAEMVAALPSSTHVVALIEVQDAEDEQPIDGAAQADVRWLHRSTTPAGQSELLDQALQALKVPDAERHAYLFGESRVVRRLRDQLTRRGLGASEISAKGYWNLGRATPD
jgi:NADPH-dependent ferric siderophore reductase